MSDINSSLIGFLKKRSLFSASPDHGQRKSNNSKEKGPLRSGIHAPKGAIDKSLNEYSSQSTNNLHKDMSARELIHHQQFEA